MTRLPTIVTAADQRFARTLLQMLASVERHALHRTHRVVVADLGLSPSGLAAIAARFPWCAVQPFDFASYPAHVRQLGTFAWKPVLLWDMVRGADAPVFWFDSGTLFHGSIDPLADAVDRDGVYTLRGQTPLGRCCDARALARLGVADEDLGEPYCAGGVIGFDPSRPVVRGVVAAWRDHALDAGCIAPAGLDPRVHRFDQAILTALLCRARREHGIPMGTEEIDISSTNPVVWLSTRNKVASWVPIWCDSLVRAFYAVWKRTDRLVLRARRDGLIRGAAATAEEGVQDALKRVRMARAAAIVPTSKTEVRGRSCHCDPRLSTHLVHSEALREACDVVADEDSNVVHPERPRVRVQALAAIAAQITEGEAVHVKSDLLAAFARHVLPSIRERFVLVTGDSDVSPVRAHAYLLEDPRLLHWFAQNCDLDGDHPRLTRIPIGFDNPVYTKLDKRLGFLAAMALGRIPFDATASRNGAGDQARLLRAREALTRHTADKPPRVLCTFHRNGVLLANADAIPDRRDACRILGDSPDCQFVERRMRQDEYWLAHDDFAFELSPRGNGLDCFRTWECLLLDTIPIVKTSPLDALYRQERLPVVIVESYREVTAHNLRRWQREHAAGFSDQMRHRLTADYWIAKITAAGRPAATYRRACSR